MDFSQRAMFVFLFVTAALDVSLAAVYKVGDSSGWTTIGNVNYSAWAASKTFRVGDTIRFEYNSKFHNVMQVTHLEYRDCNASSPMITYTTGNDSIVINNTGHYFFLCGIPTHCQIGQKVDIHVPKSSEATAPSPSGDSTSSPVGSPPISPAPVSSQKSSAPYPSSRGLVGKLGVALLGLAVCVSALVY